MIGIELVGLQGRARRRQPPQEVDVLLHPMSNEIDSFLYQLAGAFSGHPATLARLN